MDRFTLYINENVRKHPVTYTIIVLNILMLFVTITSGGFDNITLLKLGALNPVLVSTNGEYYRIFTAMFLHGGFLHIFSNMYVLLLLGRTLEKTVGSLKFAIIYFLSGIGSSILVILLASPTSVTIGASGAIFGVIGALLYVTFSKKNWFTPRSVQSIRMLVVINLFITFLIPNVSVAGHIGGLITGFLVMLVVIPDKPYFLKKVVEYYQGGEVVGDGEPTIVS